ncbi:MAG: uroporphyrinogen decarboxylase [Thermomicrobiales bacterium]|nr:uroporphyrinogen decarboxylase [Thermomicrobiales bacterium]
MTPATRLTPATSTMTARQRFLAATMRQPVDSTPVWFMRQAGRCLPEYRAMRQRYSFMEMATTPELAAEATLLPVERLGVDAAVLFADIMLPLANLGVPFEIRPGVGPIVPAPLRELADVERLESRPADEGTPYVTQALRLLRGALGERAALLGFAGAPFTLACYLVEGKPAREFPRAKAMLYGQPALWHTLMDRLTAMTIDYLQAQARAGADAVQLFDSWLGLLDHDTYQHAVLPYTRRIFAEVSPLVPTIHFSTGTDTLLAAIGESGCQVVSVDWRTSIASARARLPERVAIQGNLDPALMLAPWPTIEAAASRVLDEAGGAPGHVFNLGHGILPATDPAKLAHLVEFVHQRS